MAGCVRLFGAADAVGGNCGKAQVRPSAAGATFETRPRRCVPGGCAEHADRVDQKDMQHRTARLLNGGGVRGPSLRRSS